MQIFKLCPLAAILSLPMFAGAQTNSAGWEKGAGHFDVGSSIRPMAVSEVNGKVSYAGGNMNSSEGHNFDGSISFPVSEQFGIQADGLYSRIDDNNFYGGAGHFFWRNPEIGLIGVTGGALTRSDVDTFQAGVEAEYYWNRFTFGGFAGVGSISYATRAPFIDSDPTRFVGQVSANYYPVDDLRVGISGVTAFENSMVKGEVEYQTPVRGLAFTGEIARGEHGYDHWLLGLRYYFDGNKSLIERHRHDDPPSLMPGILQGLGLYGAEFNRKANAFVARHGGSSGGNSSYGVTSYSNYGSNYGVNDNFIIFNPTGSSGFGNVTLNP
jgi:hypothetical protein